MTSGPRPVGQGITASELRVESWPLTRNELVLIFGFWTVVALVATVNATMDPRVRGLAPAFPEAPVVLAFAEAYLWALVTPFVFWLSSRYSLERRRWAARLLLFIVVGVAISVMVEVVVGYLRFGVLFEPRPWGRPRGPQGPIAAVTRLFFLNELIVYTAILSAGFARDYFLRFRARQEEAIRLQAEAAQLQAQLAEARLAALRMQLNPHFLFNTLHAVSTLVERDPKGVRRMIARLSELLRHTMEGSGEQEVPLEQELEFLDRYLEIMRIRFQGRLEVETRIEPGLGDALVPNLILQPLVENAAKHGAAKVEGTGRIVIVVRRAGDRLVLRVRDNGPGVPESDSRAAGSASDRESGTGLGLRNTRDRLEQLYGDEQRLVLRPAEGGGMVAQIELPYHTRADLRASAAYPAVGEPG